MGKEKKYWIITNVVCALCSMFCVGLILFHNFDNNGVVSIDAFIGVAAALIGICAAIVVGFQIYSYFEFKDVKYKIDNIDKRDGRFSEELDRFEDLILNLRIDISDLYMSLAQRDKNEYIKTIFIIRALISLNTKLINKRSIYRNSSNLVLVRYKLLEEIVYKLQEWDVDPNSWDEFKKIEISSELKDYCEISRIHFSVIKRIEELVEEYKKNKNKDGQVENA